LALAARKLRRKTVAKPVELNELQELCDARLDRRPRRTRASGAHSQTIADIVGDGHMFEERIVLKDHSDMTVLHREVGRVLAVEEHAPPVGRIEAGDHPQKRGLARARGPQQSDEFSRLNVEADITQRRKGAEVLLDALDADRSATLTRSSVVVRVRRVRQRDAIRGKS